MHTDNDHVQSRSRIPMSMTGKKRSCFSHLFNPIFIHRDPGMQQIATFDNVYGLHRVYRLLMKTLEPVWEKTKSGPFILEAGNFLTDKEDNFFLSPMGNFYPNFQPSPCDHLANCSFSVFLPRSPVIFISQFLLITIYMIPSNVVYFHYIQNGFVKGYLG